MTGPLTPRHDRDERVGSRLWVHLLLLLATFVTMTTYAGAASSLNYISAVGIRPVPAVPAPWLLVGGLWFSIPALLILGSARDGPLLRVSILPDSGVAAVFRACCRSLSIVGTLGAVIRMARAPHHAAPCSTSASPGPIAGFVVLMPVAIYGVGTFLRRAPAAGGLRCRAAWTSVTRCC